MYDTWSFVCRAKASINAAADGQLAVKSNNPFSAPGSDTAGSTPDQAAQAAIDEGDIEAEGIESALVSLERVTALLTINAMQGVSLGMKVTVVFHLGLLWRHATCAPQALQPAQHPCDSRWRIASLLQLWM